MLDLSAVGTDALVAELRARRSALLKRAEDAVAGQEASKVPTAEAEQAMADFAKWNKLAEHLGAYNSDLAQALFRARDYVRPRWSMTTSETMAYSFLSEAEAAAAARRVGGEALKCSVQGWRVWDSGAEKDKEIPGYDRWVVRGATGYLADLPVSQQERDAWLGTETSAG